MDKTETYKKMCEKTEEIQEKWHRRIFEGDFTNKGVVSELDTYYEDNHWDLVVDNCVYKSTELIWLPRQDQLQEMVTTEHMPIHLIQRLNEWWQGLGYWLDKTDWSMEQLWLAFVMKVKYNKVWKGEEWSKLNTRK